jgi:hypothetical protein
MTQAMLPLRRPNSAIRAANRHVHGHRVAPPGTRYRPGSGGRRIFADSPGTALAERYLLARGLRVRDAGGDVF